MTVALASSNSAFTGERVGGGVTGEPVGGGVGGFVGELVGGSSSTVGAGVDCAFATLGDIMIIPIHSGAEAESRVFIAGRSFIVFRVFRYNLSPRCR